MSTDHIHDQTVHFVSIAEAADFLGIAKSTAYAAAKTGELCAGIPIAKIGRRYLVATAHLRQLAGITTTTKESN